MIYNSFECKSADPESIPRHIRDKEKPSVIYMALPENWQ